MTRSRPIVPVVCAALLAACGSSSTNSTDDPIANSSPQQVPAQVLPVAQRRAPTQVSNIAGSAISAFGLDVFAQTRSADPQANLTLSPTSIAIALAMLEPGAANTAQQQLREVLRIDDPASFHPSMNALEQDLEARTPGDYVPDREHLDLTIAVANAAYIQDGYPVEPAYLDAIGSDYGPTLSSVDFATNPDDAARQINDFVAEATNDQIVDLLADGTIKPETVLAIVNALYLKASWLDPFDETLTSDASFRLLDGSDVVVDMMRGSSDSSARGDGWVAANKSYVGGLSAQFILPDEGRFDEVANDLPTILTAIEQSSASGASLAVPRFETRSTVELTAILKAMGLSGPFREGGLLGIANDPNLIVDQVIHEAFVALDEKGTEAAAATAVAMVATSGPIGDPVDVVLDRPFIYRIIDNTSGATLFVGQVTNPTM